ncbi:g9365 [Coccomyxa viridis]|uniref:G9365 protein n=1 Tax=Coccomyxa viridis TaxID=1274662 RepID=A0ABP1G2U4_9CHLO
MPGDKDEASMTKRSIPPPKKGKESDVKKSLLKNKRPQNLELLIVNGLAGEGADDVCTEDQEYQAFVKTLKRKDKVLLKKAEEALKLRDDASKTQPLKYRILMSKMSVATKVIALEKLKDLVKMSPSDREFSKLKEWFNVMLDIPHGEFHTLPVSKYDKPEDIQAFLTKTRSAFEEEVYGLESVKDAFMRILAQTITNTASAAHAIGIQGPPGCGKTLGLQAFSSALGRPLHLIGLGGCKDSSYLIGHEYTYASSRHGLLVDILMRSKCMNPIILFDELDKVSDTPQGQEIIGLLIHLIDSSQNHLIQDKYLPGLQLDFSGVLFVFSYNDHTKIDPILLDRMMQMRVTGFKTRDKLAIAKRFLLPKAVKNVGLHPELVRVSDDVLGHVIERHTHGEAGVRSLKRCLECICMQINLMCLTRTATSGLSVAFDDFPMEITRGDVDVMLKEMKVENEVPFGMYI